MVQLPIYVKKLKRECECGLFRSSAYKSMKGKCFVHILRIRTMGKVASRVIFQTDSGIIFERHRRNSQWKSRAMICQVELKADWSAAGDASEVEA